MKTLHAYLTRQVLQTLVMTVLVCTSVLLLANGLREILPLMASQKASLGGIAHAVALLIPYVLVYSLPLGLLTATLLVFGRFSADQEYTAVRASGVSLVALISPVIWLSVALCCLSALVNMELGPQCRIEFKRLISRFLLMQPEAFITENRFITEFENYVIYVGKRNGNHLEDVLVNVKEDDQRLSVRAPEGTIVVDKEHNQLVLKLKKARIINWVVDSRTNAPATNPVAGTNALPQTNGVAATNAVARTNTMTATNAVSRTNLPPATNAAVSLGTNTPAGTNPPPAAPEPAARNEVKPNFAFGNVEMPIDLGKFTNVFQEVTISDMTIFQLLAKKRALAQMSDLTMPEVDRRVLASVVDVQIHRQVAFSFACLGFTLVGIPLGIRAHRKETLAGIAMALVLVLFYYAFIIIGQSMGTRPERHPHLIVWIPTFLFQIIGCWLIWRANRRVG
jgi:lipopolysaccharide export LptBFGC system permease protein LptF